jgi:hypothetical protein
MSVIQNSLQNIEELDNLSQLKYLIEEINYIFANGFKPNEEWFGNRIIKIYIYSGLEWANLHKKFLNKDNYIYSQTRKIYMNIQHILSEWSIKPIFDLYNYKCVLEDIYNLWIYYSAKYIDEDTDNDIIDLIIELSNI